jgi:hypothetical protein
MTPEELTELPDGYYQVTWNSFFLHTDRTIEKRGNGVCYVDTGIPFSVERLTGALLVEAEDLVGI